MDTERIGIDQLAAMTPDERLATIKASIITDPADNTPQITQLIADGWAEYQEHISQASPKS